MSYEGYVQCICKKGHYFEQNAFEKAKCPCGAQTGWVNAVDQTNGNSYGEIPMELLRRDYLISPAQTETCNLGHVHVTEEERFKVPKSKATDSLRHYHKHGTIPLVPIK